MIVYYAMTKFHLIFSLVHKMENYPNAEAILFLYDRLQDGEKNVERMKELHIFADIFVVPEVELKKEWKELKEDSTAEEIEENASVLAARVGEWLPYKISAEDTIYIANDHWAIGTYCICHKIPYNYYEDGVGMLSKPDYSYELVKRVNLTHAVVAKHIGAFGLNEHVIKKLADLNNQDEGFYDPKAEHYSLKESLKKLPREKRDALLYIFDAPKFRISGNATILLTEHFVNMKRLSTEGQIEMYALLVDLFSGDNKLYIKQHPNDMATPYLDVFPDAELIYRLFPSELLPYCFEGKLSLGLAACSTSIFGLNDILERSLRFDIDIECHYKKLLKYFVMAHLLKSYFPERKVQTCGIYGDLFSPLAGQGNAPDGKETEKSGVLVIDDRLSGQELISESADTVIGLDSHVFFEYCGKHNVKYMLPVIVSCIPHHREKRIVKSDREIIWIGTSQKSVFEQAKTIKWRFEMRYSDLTVDVEAMTTDKDIQIKLLEGFLDSANRKLKSCLAEQGELRSRIDTLEKENVLLAGQLEKKTKKK